MLDTVLVSPCQPAAHGGHIGQSSQTQRPFHQRVIRIITQIPQLPVSEQKMHDQAQHQGGIAKDGADREMVKTAPQSLPQSQPREELLNEDEP